MVISKYTDHNQLLISSVAARLPWNILKVVHINTDLALSRGWDATEEKWLNLDKDNKFLPAVEREVYNTYLDYLYNGDKAIAIYNCDKKTFVTVIAAAERMIPTIKAADIKFPFEDSTSDGLLTAKPKLTDIKKTSQGIFLTYASVKTVIETIELNTSDLKASIADTVRGKFHRLSAQRIIQKRCYDHIFLRLSDETIEHRLDTSGHFPRNKIDESLIDLNVSFRGDLAKHLEPKALKMSVENFFLVIPALYQESSDRACELGFCVEDVIHNEAVRAGDRDLRTEKFHQAGVESVDGMDIYRIAVRKQHKIGNGLYESELYIPGSLRMSGDGSTSFLQYCIISNCLTQSNYDYFIDSMKSCLIEYKKGKA